MRKAGQTYDELLAELIEERKKHRLAQMAKEKREEGEFVEVDPEEW